MQALFAFPAPPSRRPRDSQRSRLYHAERQHSRFAHPRWQGGRRVSTAPDALPTIAECQAYITKITRSAWFRRHFGTYLIAVDNSQGKGGACASRSRIYMSEYYRFPLMLLHELAHCLTWRYADHGREYAQVYLRLVTRWLGREAGRELRALFRKERVRYTPPRKRRELTEEQRQALAARLAQGRAARAARPA